MSTEKNTHANNKESVNSKESANSTSQFSIDGLQDDIKNSLAQASQPNEIEQLIFDRLIQVDANFVEPEPLLSLESDFNDDKKVAVFSRQNISTLKGKAKSRKTFLNVLLSQMLVDQNPDIKILYIDTEQGDAHANKVQRRIFDINNWKFEPTEQFHLYALRDLKTEERATAVRILIEKHTPDFVFLDGVRDIMFDFNDLHESANTVNLLMELSKEFDCHVLSVLHENKNDNNARGHAGTELMNKSETVLSVALDSIDKNISTVKSTYSKNGDFKEFSFEIDSYTIPRITQAPEQPIKPDKDKVLLDMILLRGEKMQAKDLVPIIMEKGKNGKGVGESAAYKILKRGIKNEIIKKTANRLYYSVANNDGKELQDDAIQSEISEISDSDILNSNPPF